MQVSELQPLESVYLDTDRLDEICSQLGYAGGENAICATMEDLAALLTQAGKLWRVDEMQALQDAAGKIAELATRIGMNGLARVSRDVHGLAEGRDAAALGATVARMRRLGDQSLLAIWDRQDLMV